MKTTTLRVRDYYAKESTKKFFKDNYCVFIKGAYYPIMHYEISDDYDYGYKVSFTANNKDTALIIQAITILSKGV